MWTRRVVLSGGEVGETKLWRRAPFQFRLFCRRPRSAKLARARRSLLPFGPGESEKAICPPPRKQNISRETLKTSDRMADASGGIVEWQFQVRVGCPPAA